MAVMKTGEPLLLGSNFSQKKADKKRNVFVKTSIKLLFAAKQGFCKTNALLKMLRIFVENSQLKIKDILSGSQFSTVFLQNF